MDVRLQAFADQQGGAFTRTQVRQVGLTDMTIDANVRRRTWHRLRPGVYVEYGSWAEASPVQRHRMAAHAVALRLDEDAVFSHLTGAVLRGWPTWNVSLDEVCVTRTHGGSGRREAGVHHFRGTLSEARIEVVDGLRVCGMERLMVDAAREYGFEEAVVICDAALRAGADRELARRLYLEAFDWPKSRQAIAALQFADGRAENPAESRLRVRLHAYGVTGFEPQQCIHSKEDGRFLGRGDLVDWESRTLVEFDGKSKYGIDGKDPREQVWQEKVREQAMRDSADFEVERITWPQLDRPAVLADRVAATQARGLRRQGRPVKR